MDNSVLKFMLALKKRFNIDLSAFENDFLLKQTTRFVEENHAQSAIELIDRFNKAPGLIEAFKKTLHIAYSEFFRDPYTFAVIEKIVLPDLVYRAKKKGQGEIRIWSAACASGQEVYTITMLLKELKISRNEQLGYRVFGTDISPELIIEASKGKYHESSLRNVPLNRIKQWFTFCNDHYEVNEELKENTDFSVFNLLDKNLICPPSSIFGCFDLIMCSNVLFYYSASARTMIVEKLSRCISDGGYIVTSETEREFLLTYNAVEVIPQSGIFQFRRNI